MPYKFQQALGHSRSLAGLEGFGHWVRNLALEFRKNSNGRMAAGLAWAKESAFSNKSSRTLLWTLACVGSVTSS